ncbi:S-adenosyl-L-methionine-dependent methyltransferase [Xylariaceae sp. FL0804]|nr:S-adenosyl-L-methionine-dependent methyltransferase [Xylariaceae sp. FL0804]
MAAPSTFVPKQALPFDSKLIDIIGGDETQAIAQYEMTLLPAFPSDTVLHDTACGLGPVTQSVLATAPPSSIQIHASDAAPPMVGLYNDMASAQGWSSRAVIMDAQKLEFPDSTFSHVFLSFGLPIMEDPVAAAKEMYRTLKPGGTAITAFWLHIPQGECAQETRRAVWGPNARLAVEPKPEHKDRGYNRDLLVKGGFQLGDIQLYEKSVFLPVKSLDELAVGIWSAIGQPEGGWSQEDEEKWYEAVAKYKELLPKESGFHQDSEGNITLEATAQIAIARKTD